MIAKGWYQSLRAEGIEGLRRHIVETEPRLAKNVESLTDWHQVALLSVESSRCRRWYEPGLLLVGHAGHAMSHGGGVGINYAVQDAIVAANFLTTPLLGGRVMTGQLEAIQGKRAPCGLFKAFKRSVRSG